MKYSCEKCLFETNQKQKYDKHMISTRHKNIEDENIMHLQCNICNKKYSSRSGLWNHKKTCKVQTAIENTVITTNNVYNKDLLLEQLIKEIENLKNIICNNNNNSNKETTTTNITNEITEIKEVKEMKNEFNNNFNINFFLNEKCKDAMNIKDFIRSLQVDMNDLETIENEGYMNGMSHVIQKKLSAHSIYKRPIHYEINHKKQNKAIHIKYNDMWKKETNQKKPLLLKTIHRIDEIVFDKYRDVKDSISKEEHPRMEKELMMGSYESVREEVSNMVLEKVQIDDHLINNS
jgi:hypothetical protein